MSQKLHHRGHRPSFQVESLAAGAGLQQMKVKEDSERVGLKLNIQKTKIMASGPITSWEIHGETGETVSDFIFGGSKISADGDCSMKLKDTYSLEEKL